MFFNSYIVAELLGRYLAIVERNEKKEFSEEDEILKDLFNLPFSEAIDFFLSKKPELYDKLDITTDNSLDDYFWIKKSTDLEVTKKIQDKLLKTLEEGKTYSDFKKELDLESLGLGEGGHYWKGAFDMNMAFAQSRGQYEEQLEGIQYGFEYGLFDAILDGRETETCHNLDGKVMLLTDWIEQGMYPPLHYRCRSRIIAITEEDVKDMGVTVEKKIEHAHVQKNFGKFSTREKDLEKICTKKEKEVEVNKKKIQEKTIENSEKRGIILERKFEYLKDFQEAISNFGKVSKSNYKKLTNFSTGYIRSNNSFYINAYLRGIINQLDNAKSFETIAILDKVIQKNTLNKNIKADRYVNVDWAYNVAKHLNVSDYDRILKSNDLKEIFNILKKMEKNSYVEKSFISVSAIPSKNVFQSKPIKLIFNILEKTNAFATQNIAESEIVLARGNEITFKKIELSRTHIVIEAEIGQVK